MPWLGKPKCQSCHVGDVLNHQGNNIVSRLAYNPDDKAATPILADNKRFAEPDTGLYRFSTGHGGMDCTSCHDSPHAIWPNADKNANDNIAATQIQGHAGTITECNSCHTPAACRSHWPDHTVCTTSTTRDGVKSTVIFMKTTPPAVKVVMV